MSVPALHPFIVEFWKWKWIFKIYIVIPCPLPIGIHWPITFSKEIELSHNYLKMYVCQCFVLFIFYCSVNFFLILSCRNPSSLLVAVTVQTLSSENVLVSFIFLFSLSFKKRLCFFRFLYVIEVWNVIYSINYFIHLYLSTLTC